MKTFGKIVICILVILLAVAVACLIVNKKEEQANSDSTSNTDKSNQNTVNNTIDRNEDYIGEEENIQNPNSGEEQLPSEDNEDDNNQSEELTGKDKAVDIVKKKFALEGQTVSFDHMEGTNYVIKINNGTALTWYLVNGTTWEAEEY